MAGEWSLPDGYATRSRMVVRTEFATAKRGQCLSPGFDRLTLRDAAGHAPSVDGLHAIDRGASLGGVVHEGYGGGVYSPDLLLVHEPYRSSHESPRIRTRPRPA